jgi:3-methylcrotonyl-CoA carboxylase alpha subunit
MISSVLIANRGEIACRIIRTARRLGIRTIGVYSDADRFSLFVKMADEAYRIGPPPARESYLNGAEIIRIAQISEADAIHPGYGFLSENADFAEACELASIVFVGPSAQAIRSMGLKDRAKEHVSEAGVAVVPGYYGEDQHDDVLSDQAHEIGFPVLIKAVAGGGGKGMRRVDHEDGFSMALDEARREAANTFGNDRVLIEKYLVQSRHVEVQIFADTQGNTVHLFERDCSLQRRHQKVIEEAPAPGMTETLREKMGAAAVRAARAVNYVGAGTVEFIVDSAGGLSEDAFYFMEMNTRLQVEHPVTELITGVDLVEWQLCVASGMPLPVAQDDLRISGHAIEARIYAEQPSRNFMPSVGKICQLTDPTDHKAVRIDTGIRDGDEITLHYDPMIAKVIAHGDSRDEAIGRLVRALQCYRLSGCETNIEFLQSLLADQQVRDAQLDTGMIDRNLDALTTVSAMPDVVSALAALAYAGTLEDSKSLDPWDSLYGWRAWGGTTQTVSLDGEKGAVSVRIVNVTNSATIKTVVLQVDDKALTLCLTRVVRIGAGWEVTLETDGHQSQAHCVVINDRIDVFVPFGRYGFDIHSTHDDEQDGGSNEDTVLAPLPGVVQSLLVKVGDEVSHHQPIIVLEAMKMNHTMTATGPAIVDSIHCAEGDQVSEGTILIRFSHDSVGQVRE